MANINTVLRRFHANGGSLVIDDGTNTNTIKQLEPGSLELIEGGVEAIEHADDGSQQVPLVGDQRPSTIRFTARRGHSGTGVTAADNIDAQLRQQPSSPTDHEVFTFTVTVRVPDAPGATTGVQLVANECYVRTPPTVLRSGQQFDMVSYELGSTDAFFTVTRYTGS